MLGLIENVAYFNKDKEEEKSPINTTLAMSHAVHRW
jgi:hypothetical protein